VECRCICGAGSVADAIGKGGEGGAAAGAGATAGEAAGGRGGAGVGATGAAGLGATHCPASQMRAPLHSVSLLHCADDCVVTSNTKLAPAISNKQPDHIFNEFSGQLV